MGKRKRENEKRDERKRKRRRMEDENYLKKKIRKLEEKLRDLEPTLSPSSRPSTSTSRSRTPRSLSPPTAQLPTPPPPPPSPPPSPRPPPPPPPPPPQMEQDEDELPEEFLLALGPEGQEKIEVGDPIQPEIALRWKRIMNVGLGKEAKEAIVKKYPTPANFQAAVAPILNPEFLVTLSELSIKRDKRIISRQNLLGILLTCLGKSLTNLLKGNINSKMLIEEINDAAKLASEVYYHDSSSRKFFAVAGATKTVQDAVSQAQTDKYLFGEDCADKIKAAQALQKGSTKQAAATKNKQLNWRGLPQFKKKLHHQARGGPRQHQQRPYSSKPHQKGRQSSYKPKPRYRH